MSNLSGYTAHEGCDHIFFVGFLGAGKSTLARNLGSLFNREYVDIDRLVERRAHMSVREIFEKYGEKAFRQSETEALVTLKSRKSLLVSCGGGIVESPLSCNMMHQMGAVVYLDGDLSDSMRQIQNRSKRPDLGLPEQTKKLFAHRRPLYQQNADLIVDIRGRTFDEVAESTAALLWEKGLL